MVAPTSGPFYESQELAIRAVGSYRFRKRRYRQKKPYNLPLPYLRSFRETVLCQYYGLSAPPSWADATVGHSPTAGYASCWDIDTGTSSTVPSLWRAVDLARNKARSRLSEAMGETASVGISIVQSGQALSMIQGRSLQLLRFCNRLRKFDFPGAARELGVLEDARFKRLRLEGKLKKKAHAFADNFLELHFGWSPLIGDIYSAAGVLQGPIPLGTVEASATVRDTYDSDSTLGFSRTTIWREDVVRCKISVHASVSNPNLWLANRLGLINPATVLWDAIPFSFVAGWLWNIEQMLTQYSEFAGLTLSNASTSERLWSMAGYHNRTLPGVLPASGLRVVSRGVSSQRWLGLPGVTLRAKPLKLPSPSRALTAVSLLIQKGLGKR